MTEATQEPLDTWAVVELMGHVTIIGHVTEAMLAGVPVLRIARPDDRAQYVAPQSLYRLTPCTEDEARAGYASMSRWGGTGLPSALPQPRPAIAAAGDEAEADAIAREEAGEDWDAPDRARDDDDLDDGDEEEPL